MHDLADIVVVKDRQFRDLVDLEREEQRLGLEIGRLQD